MNKYQLNDLMNYFYFDNELINRLTSIDNNVQKL